ncbi:hypothetical protein AX16_009789 [Volvariella volvacea WC 439]|nr:hypothetical protein AX16_009789 [Volvariella volvacea WC 439]
MSNSQSAQPSCQRPSSKERQTKPDEPRLDESLPDESAEIEQDLRDTHSRVSSEEMPPGYSSTVNPRHWSQSPIVLARFSGNQDTPPLYHELETRFRHLPTRPPVQFGDYLERKSVFIVDNGTDYTGIQGNREGKMYHVAYLMQRNVVARLGPVFNQKEAPTANQVSSTYKEDFGPEDLFLAPLFYCTSCFLPLEAIRCKWYIPPPGKFIYPQIYEFFPDPYSGCVDAAVYLPNIKSDVSMPRAPIVVQVRDGSNINLRVRDEKNTGYRPVIHIRISIKIGKVRLTLPDSFEGIVQICTIEDLSKREALDDMHQQLYEGEEEKIFTIGCVDRGQKRPYDTAIVTFAKGGEVTIHHREYWLYV